MTTAQTRLPARMVPVEWLDRLAGSDPGHNRLRLALQSVLSIGAILAAERVFVGVTHALQIQTHGAALPPAQAAAVAAANHEFLVVGLLLGAILGMISSFGVMDPDARGQLTSMLLLPIPMIIGLVVGIGLGGHRLAALSSLVVALAGGTYLRRFGPRGFIAGNLLFMGDFFGFFLHGAVGMSDLGRLVAELAVGVATAIVIRFVFFFPHPDKALARTERSYAARARKVAALALTLLEDPTHSERSARQLRRQLVRLNEAALMIDAQLGDAGAVSDGSSAQRLHQRLFDVELALTNVARFAAALSRTPVPDDQRLAVRLALRALVDRRPDDARVHAATVMGLLTDSEPTTTDEGRTAAVVVHRFALSVDGLAEAMTGWEELGKAVAEDSATFTPSVVLFGGWLPGSAAVSAVASQERGARGWDRIRLEPYSRTALQMAVAVGGAIALGDLLSGRRFYWAVIAAFVTFMGANNSGEQARKAGYRVLGTIVGVVLGSLLVQATGHHTYASLAVILAALFLSFYLMRINYTFMVIGITVMVSQLYVQLDEFSNSLLRLRVEETAIGAGVAAATVLVVLPLRTRHVLRVALRSYIEALTTMADHAIERLLDGPESAAGGHLRADARRLDAAYQAVVATVVPLRRAIGGELDERVAGATRVASASRHYMRNLVVDAQGADGLDPATCAAVTRAREAMLDSLRLVGDATTGPRDGTYLRSASLFDEAERAVECTAGTVGPAQLALRDLSLVDGSLASLAQLMGLRVTDLDTSALRSVPVP